MIVAGPLDRILRTLGSPSLIDDLGERVAGADLTSLLLEVMRRRAARVRAPELLQRYARDRFVGAPLASFAALRRVEDALLAACPGFDVVALAPLVPLGTHSAIATVDQNKVVSTTRHNEVAADPTNALALEAATRRNAVLRDEPKSAAVVRLAATQRVVRAQQVVGPRHFAHFQLFGFVSAGRDSGGRTFEANAAAEHLVVHVRAIAALGAEAITVALTDLSGGTAAAIKTTVRAALAPFSIVHCVDDDARASGRGYYQSFCFKVHARFAADTFETSDGGVVDWTQRLVGSAKERCFISGIGVDRLALVVAE
jgi:hypothetical protein